MVACLTPATGGQLTSGDSEGASSCVAYSFDYGVCEATNGIVHPSGEIIRDWTGDHTGGLELGQCDTALFVHTGVIFDTEVVDWPTYNKRLDGGEGAVTLIGYGPFADSEFSGCDPFRSNHGIWVPPSRKIKDPLADGRHASWGRAYEYHGEVYPSSLIHAATSALVLSNRKTAGPNHIEASFIKMRPPVTNPPVRLWHVSVDPGDVVFYTVDSKQVARVGSIRHTGGFSASISSPHIYKFPGKKLHSVKLVKILSRGYKGKYLNYYAKRVHVKEI